MFPRRTVPKLPLESPTNESREPKVPVPTSKLVDCSSCQMAFKPPKPLPRPRSPRKPIYELPTSMVCRGGGFSQTTPPGVLTHCAALIVWIVAAVTPDPD